MAFNIAILQDYLAMAERHIASGNRVITRQRQLINQLEADGHDIRAARSLLARFEDLQASHLADRDRLIKEISSAQARH